MMRVALLLLLVACSKKDPRAEVKPVTADARCVIQLFIAADQIRVTGGGLGAPIDRKPGEKPDLSSLQLYTDECDVDVDAASETDYQDVITLIDGLVGLGFPDVGLGHEPKPAPSTKPPKEPPRNREGKIVLPTLVITTTELAFEGKTIAKVDDPDLATTVKTAVGKATEDAAIIQADARLKYGPIRAAVSGLKSAGYRNVLFAVKNP